MDLKLGKLPAVRPHGLSELSTYALGKIPAPPKEAHYGELVKDFPMFGNDRLGDCVVAGAAHLVQAWDAEVHRSDAVPTDAEVISEYFTLTGGADSGLNEASVLQTWHRSGLWGHRIDGYAPVNPKDLVAIHQSIAFYGGTMLGIACPQSAQQQFAEGEPWTVVADSPVIGGHCIDLVGYDEHYLYAVTWGKIVSITYPWASAYVDEAWCIIPDQFVEASRGPALDLATLRADLARI